MSSPRKLVIESANLDIRSKYIMGSYKHREPVSPHTLMGVSCSIVGLVILTLTVGLVVRSYSAAPTIRIPKDGEDEVMATQLYSTSLLTRTASVASVASYIDIESFTDAGTYSFTEGEAELPCTDTGLSGTTQDKPAPGFV